MGIARSRSCASDDDPDGNAGSTPAPAARPRPAFAHRSSGHAGFGPPPPDRGRPSGRITALWGGRMDGLIELLVVIVLVGIVTAGAVVAAATLIGRVVVHEYERGVRMDSGRVIGLVGPGVIAYLKPRT